MPLSSSQIAAMAPVSQQMGPYGSTAAMPYGGTVPFGYNQPVGQAFGMGYGPAPTPPLSAATGAFNPNAGPAMSLLSYGSGMGGAQLTGERIAASSANTAATLGTGLSWINTGAGIASMLGYGGATMAAVGGIPAALGVGAFAYGAGQMASGVQERVGVNRVLRSNFGGMTGIGSGSGGQGFGSAEMGQVSQMVRSIANNDMFSNVEELTRVMDQTAQMGLYRGVRSAREFQTKFKQTVESLREISSIMGTTLEGASSMMQQQRGLGFFSGQDITRNLLQTRTTAAATGMSVEQIGQMQQVGTQYGRMLGMRGRTGAQAMLSIGGNIGQAMRMGILTDEMVAEATGGLTGAEGAQAMAQRTMEANSRWLQRGAGRAMMAGLWNREGGFDEGLLRQVSQGNISLHQLRSRGRANIAMTGGRNSEFYLNENRLRGELMSQHGGAMMIGAMAEHISRRRGVSTDDPIVQRWLQRQTGLNQPELESQLAIYERMPEIEAQRAVSARQELGNIARTKNQERTGIQGKMRKWSDWWQRTATEPFREMGDRLVTRWSRRIEEMTDAMEGRVKLAISDETKQALTAYAMTGQSTAGTLMQGADYTKYQAKLLAWRARGGGGSDTMALIGKGAGRMFGFRSSENEMEQAAALGLVQQYGGSTYYRGAGANKQAVYGMEFSNLVEQANEKIYGSTRETFGLDAGQASELGKSAARILTSQMSGRSLAAYQDRLAEASLQERKQMTLEKINLMRSKSPELNSFFSKVGPNFVDQISAYQVLAQEGKFSGTSYGPALGGTGVSQGSLEYITRIATLKQRDSLTGIANVLNAGLRPKRMGGRGYSTGGVGILGAVTTDVVGELLESSETRDLLKTFSQGGRGAQDALASLRILAAQKGENQTLSESQLRGLQQITDEGVLGTLQGAEKIQGALREYFDAELFKQGTALQRRNREMGLLMGRSLEKDRYRFEEANLSELHGTLREIADKRSKGESASDLERKLLSDSRYLENPDVASLLSNTPGLEYLGAGMAKSTMIARELSTPDRRLNRADRGLSKSARLLRMTLSAAGLENVSRNQLLELTAIGERGDQTGLLARMKEMAGGDQTKLERMQRAASLVSESVGIIGDKQVTQEEIRKFSGMFGAGRAAGLALEGSQNEARSTQEYQQKHMWLMQEQLKMMTKLASKDPEGELKKLTKLFEEKGFLEE